MGFVYEAMGNPDKALEDFYEAEKILIDLKNKDFLANVRHSIGSALVGKGRYDEAIVKFELAKATFLEMGNRDYYANCLGSLGNIYELKEQYKEALKMYQEALAIKKEVGNPEGIATGLILMADVHIRTKNFREAEKILTEAHQLTKESGHSINEANALNRLAYTYEGMGQYKQSAQYFKEYGILRDSLFKKESLQTLAEMSAAYENEKQAAEIVLLSEQKKAQEEHIKVTNLQKKMLSGGVVAMLLLALLVFRSYRIKQKANVEMKAAYTEIQRNRDEIAYQKQEIMDSIHYANRIQTAILPNTDLLTENFSEHFVMYLPKDVVSGDLYWFSKVKNKLLFAVVDCTGHGVPGAFMSVIAVDNLNNIVNDKQLSHPAAILTELDRKVSGSFSKSGEGSEIQDGMDVAFCSMDVTTKELHFAGAHRPLIHFRNGVVTEIKATKASIGGYQEEKNFEDNVIQLQKGDRLYMFSDGYVDQFGGPTGKKFKYKQLEDLLLSVQDKSMQEQQAVLQVRLDEWKGTLEQIDDICVIGLRL
jgi:serine phosphatase RsbU (regulator of sigma subunit)